MRGIYSIILVFLMFAAINAQDTWEKKYEPFGISVWPHWMYFTKYVQICSDGNYLVNGSYYYHDEEGVFGDAQGYLMKTDTDGEILWIKRDTVSFCNSSESEAFVETADGGFISACGVLPGPGWFIKRDSEGNREWSIPPSNYYWYTLDATSDGNVIAGGTRSDGWPTLLKMTPQGDTIFCKSYMLPGYYRGWSVSVRQSNIGGYLVAGGIDEEDGYTDAFVMKTDENGDSLWMRTYDRANYVDGCQFIFEVDTGQILSGGIALPDQYGFLWLLGQNGETIWIEVPDIEFVKRIYSGMPINDDTFTIIGAGYQGYNIFNMDIDRNINWSHTFSGEFAKKDKSLQMHENNGYLYCETLGRITLVKTNELGQVIGINNEYKIQEKTRGLKCYPNPFNPVINISFSLDSMSLVKLKVYNVKGQVVCTILDNYLSSGNRSIKWNGTDDAGQQLSTGIYFIECESNGQILGREKVILLK